MADSLRKGWKHELLDTARSPRIKAKIVGLSRIDYAQHAALVRTALLAFGDNPSATFFIDGLPAEGDLPRPDLIILHPEVGALVIENKGITLECIHGLENHVFQITRNGVLQEEDPFHQAERVMFALRDLCKTRLNLDEVLFLRTAAFPRLRRSELEGRFRQQLPGEALFSDACYDPAEFKAQVLRLSQHEFQKTRKTHKLTREAHDGIMTILSGKALFHPARRTRITETDPKRLGVQIQQMELAMREATQEQKDLGRADLRGSHRLFRGVAGSGKSIMLALSVAQTLVLNREDAGTLFEDRRTRRVLALCYNRALVQYLRNRIEDRLGRIAWDKPSEAELLVTHFEGLVRELQSRDKRLETGLDHEHREARARALCTHIDRLPVAEREAISFDAVYVDEAQDLLSVEFEVLRRIARSDPEHGQTLILFYDNAQNIYGVNSPTWEKLGINIVGRTVFLDSCLRNTREVLKFAFNILVGAFAQEGQRAATRQFADVASLRQRRLIEERNGVFEVLFSTRNGPVPQVRQYPSRAAEVAGLVQELQRLFTEESVLPSDLLILYKSDYLFKDILVPQVERVLPRGYRIRQVDRLHHANKNLPLMEDGFLTISTIASAKGYDAPIVFLLGADQLATDSQGRASCYVGLTRGKFMVYVSGLQRADNGLLPEILQSAKHASADIAHPRKSSDALEEPSRFQDLAVSAPPVPTREYACQHCGSKRLHCQQGGSGYYFVCIDCTKITTLPRKCSNCGANARVRARGMKMVRICKACDTSEIVHANLPLELLEG